MRHFVRIVGRIFAAAAGALLVLSCVTVNGDTQNALAIGGVAAAFLSVVSMAVEDDC